MSLTARIAATFNRSGAARDNVVGAVAMPAVSRGYEGSGAPVCRPLRAPLAVLALAIVTFAISATPAVAAPLDAKMDTISEVSYDSARVTGEITTPGGFFTTGYTFQYSKNPETEGWTGGPGGEFPAGSDGVQPVNAKIPGLKGGTEYFVRLTATSFLTTVNSPEPYLSFITLPVDPPTIPGAAGASSIFSTTAAATGKVKRPANSDPAFDVRCHFEYITDAQFTANEGNGNPGFTGATVRGCAQNPITEAKVDVGGELEVTAQLGCPNPVLEAPEGKCPLDPGTTYHLRLAAENAAPGVVTKEAANFTTAAKVAAPSVITANNATDVSYSTAKVSGKIQRPAGTDPAFDTSCRFEYLTDEQFTHNEDESLPPFEGAGQAPCVEAPAGAPLTGTDPTSVSAELTGLPLSTTGTTYHLRLTAENGGGTTSKDAAETFTTLAAVDPVLEVNPIAPADVGYTTAHVTGTIDSGEPEHTINWDIQIFTDPDEPESGSICCSSKPGKLNEYSRDFTGLNPGTTYYARLSGGDYAGGSIVGFFFSPKPYESFTTKGTADPPIATLDPVADFTATTAHFSGTVDPHAPAGPLDDEGKAAYKTDWHIECVPECKNANGNEIAGTVEAEEDAKAISVDAKRLEPSTGYEVKLVAHNILGTVESVQSFHTSKTPPTVKQTPGASDDTGGYTLQGIVNPSNQTITACEFKWGPDASKYAFSANCSPLSISGSKPITVEAHLTGLTPDVDYHALLVVKYKADSGPDIETDSGEDQKFTATLAAKEPCPENEQERVENNSLALPECRAYEMVSPAGKEGFGAGLISYDGGDRVLYKSEAGNIAKSGQGLIGSFYVATRSTAGWKTIPNLNGPTGSIFDAPSNFETHNLGGPGPGRYSSDLLSSVWFATKSGSTVKNYYLRGSDGLFTLLATGGESGIGGFQIGGTSDDLSHLFITSNAGGTGFVPTYWGPGVYEFLGTGNEQPSRRVDVDNSGAPITSCSWSGGSSAKLEFNSSDGRVAVSRVAGGCGGANPPSTGLWARIGGTTSVNIAASQCDRTVADPGGACNDPVGSDGCANGLSGEEGPGCRGLQFQGATPDGSRVFFTTGQQLLDADTDEANDLYACDIPSGTPAPVGDEKANPCAALRQVSAGDPTGAAVESFGAVSANGATALFTATGALADNEDAFGEEAAAGDHNLYVWRTDAAHPDGQTTFLARLDSNDINAAQATPDGRYLVFTTASRLVDTDTDNARDVYRYDADAGELTRASTNVLGVAGNSDGFDAVIPAPENDRGRLLHPAVSNDGSRIAFTTVEALSTADGNGEPDLYLWTPARVSLISTGSSGSAPRDNQGNVLSIRAAIDGSGQNIYFESAQPLTPADADGQADVYTARIGGGFSFAQAATCSGEACQPAAPPAPPRRAPSSAQQGSGNPPLAKPCPKGKVKRNGKCIRKHKKHKKHNGKKASHKQGGGK